jgi:hypothetical protein
MPIKKDYLDSELEYLRDDNITLFNEYLDESLSVLRM